jgi:hypothetical protein
MVPVAIPKVCGVAAFSARVNMPPNSESFGSKKAPNPLFCKADIPRMFAQVAKQPNRHALAGFFESAALINQSGEYVKIKPAIFTSSAHKSAQKSTAASLR